MSAATGYRVARFRFGLALLTPNGGILRFSWLPRRGGWVAYNGDAAGWSSWPAAVTAGILSTHNYGPGCYGHTDLILTGYDAAGVRS